MAISSLQLLHHGCGILCQLNCDHVKVLDSLNGDQRPICLVYWTTALCDIFVKQHWMEKVLLAYFLMSQFLYCIALSDLLAVDL